MSSSFTKKQEHCAKTCKSTVEDNTLYKSLFESEDAHVKSVSFSKFSRKKLPLQGTLVC